ncbi:hypothetical protein [Corynebacterium epidermidicanis]|nr:hypothetical protein [Corynebacterium epidermidicanis]
MGSEKMSHFADPAVVDRLAELGIQVEATPSGSRKIATLPDLKNFDAAFPSSAPAAENISQETGRKVHLRSVLFAHGQALQAQQVIVEKNGVAYLDVAKYLELAKSGKRW